MGTIFIFYLFIYFCLSKVMSNLDSILKSRDISPIISWQTDGETMETVTDFIFLGSKITADGACSHEIKRHVLLGQLYNCKGSPSGSVVKNPPEMQGMWVQSPLGWEDHLETGMSTHSSVLAWKIP